MRNTKHTVPIVGFFLLLFIFLLSFMLVNKNSSSLIDSYLALCSIDETTSSCYSPIYVIAGLSLVAYIIYRLIFWVIKTMLLNGKERKNIKIILFCMVFNFFFIHSIGIFLSSIW